MPTPSNAPVFPSPYPLWLNRLEGWLKRHQHKFDLRGKSNTPEPEILILAAVIKQAQLDFLGTDPNNPHLHIHRRHRYTARCFLMSQDGLEKTLRLNGLNKIDISAIRRYTLLMERQMYANYLQRQNLFNKTASPQPMSNWQLTINKGHNIHTPSEN